MKRGAIIVGAFAGFVGWTLRIVLKIGALVENESLILANEARERVSTNALLVGNVGDIWRRPTVQSAFLSDTTSKPGFRPPVLSFMAGIDSLL